MPTETPPDELIKESVDLSVYGQGEIEHPLIEGERGPVNRESSRFIWERDSLLGSDASKKMEDRFVRGLLKAASDFTEEEISLKGGGTSINKAGLSLDAFNIYLKGGLAAMDGERNPSAIRKPLRVIAEKYYADTLKKSRNPRLKIKDGSVDVIIYKDRHEKKRVQEKNREAPEKVFKRIEQLGKFLDENYPEDPNYPEEKFSIAE